MKQFLIFNFKFLDKEKGIASLPIVLLISGIVLELGIASLALSTISSRTSADAKFSMIALQAAYSGAEEGLLKIVQDKKYPTSSCSLPATTLQLGSALFIDGATADVCITKNSATRRTIVSTGTVQNRKKRVQVVLAIDEAFTGQVQLISFEEV